MKSVIAVVLMIMSLHNAFCSAEFENQKKARSIFEKGLDAYRKGNYEESLSVFREGALIDTDNFTTASFYYNAGNSSYMMAEKAGNSTEKKELLEQSIKDYLRCLDFCPDFNSAKHNGELAIKNLNELEKENPDNGKKNGSNESSMDDLIREQKNLKNKTAQDTGDKKDLEQKQKEIREKTQAQKQGGKDKSIERAMEMQEENEKLLKQGDYDESAMKQEEIIKLLEQARDNQKKSDEEKKEEYLEYINKLEKEKENMQQMQQSGGIQEVERNW